MHAQLGVLRRTAAELGQASSVDDIARSALTAALGCPGVTRAAIALNRLGGRQLQFVSTDEGRLGASLRWCLIDTFERLPLTHVVRTGDDLFLGTAEKLRAGYPEYAAAQADRGVGALAALALSTGTERLGGLLVSYAAPQRFDDDARWFLVSLAALVTQALRRERAREATVSTAESLQRSLLPSSLPVVDGLALSARYRPGPMAEVGGDWYDVFDVGDHGTAFVVGDVMGKGAQAAVMMGEVRTALRAYALTDPRPSAVLAQLDRYVSLTKPDHLVTLVYGVVSCERDELRVAAAGHPPPMLVTPEEAPEVLGAALGPALGLGAGPWPEQRVPLAPRTSVFAYTDGLVRGRGVDLFEGMDLLGAALASLPAARRKPRDLCSRASAATSHLGGTDDVTMLALSCAPSSAFALARQDLPQDPVAASMARRFLRRTLEEWELDEVADVAQLCTSELVTNAVMHGGSSIAISLELDGPLLTVLVEDRGGRGIVEPDPHLEPTPVSGRGLAIVEAMSSAWGSEQTPDLTLVWFELEVSREQPEEAGTPEPARTRPRSPAPPAPPPA